MKLREKLFLFSIMFISIWIVMMMFLMDKTVITGYQSLEESWFEGVIERAENGIYNLISTQETIVKDWTKWDEAYRFVQNTDPVFIEENISESIFIDLRLNNILLFDSEYQLITAKGYNIENEEFVPVPESLISEILQFKNQSGLIYIDNQPLAFSAFQVTDSEGTEKPLGLFVFSFYLNDIHLQELSDSLKEEITISTMAVPFESDKYETIVKPYDTYSVAEYYSPYLNTSSALKLDILLSHGITELGKETVRKSLTMFIISFLLLSFIVYLGVRHSVLRITSISLAVSNISHSRDLKQRLSIKGSDELGILSDDINFMLDKIEKMNRQLTEYATFDIMTGLVNRRIGFEKLEHLIEASNETHFDLTICFIDINDLKYVNDVYGHNAGDQMIIDISEILINYTRTTDILCRLGGDEFLIIFPYCDEDHAVETLERINHEIDFFNNQNKLQYNLCISKGIIEYDGLMSTDEFVEKADALMYEDKRRIKALRNADTEQ